MSRAEIFQHICEVFPRLQEFSRPLKGFQTKVGDAMRRAEVVLNSEKANCEFRFDPKSVRPAVLLLCYIVTAETKHPPEPS